MNSQARTTGVRTTRARASQRTAPRTDRNHQADPMTTTTPSAVNSSRRTPPFRAKPTSTTAAARAARKAARASHLAAAGALACGLVVGRSGAG